MAHFKTIRIFLALAAQFKWSILHFDVGGLNEEVFVLQPEGFVVSVEENKFYKLKRLYMGLSKLHAHDARKLIPFLLKMVSNEVQVSLLFILEGRAFVISLVVC